jgi:hypothetical protein
MKALLAIAGKVQKGGKHVTLDDVAAARLCGAIDKEEKRQLKSLR